MGKFAGKRVHVVRIAKNKVGDGFEVLAIAICKRLQDGILTKVGRELVSNGVPSILAPPSLAVFSFAT